MRGKSVPECACLLFLSLIRCFSLAINYTARFVFIVVLLALTGCHPANHRFVVVYTSQDQEYAEPILREFSQQTGIEARAVYDSEAVKTVGLANRLLAEREHPQCDVFWNNEELRTRQLAAQGLFHATNAWLPLGYRSRRMVLNTNRLSLANAPAKLEALTNAVWRGKVALAYPLFGTTSTHFLALRQRWGEATWQQWCRALRANQPLIVDGNSVVVKMVGSGEAWIGLTDSDDIQAGQREGLPIAEMPLGETSLLIPNTVAAVRDAPHPQEAQNLITWLQKPEVIGQLVQHHALEGAAMSAVPTPTLAVDWNVLLRDLEPATQTLKEVFLR